MSQYIIQAFIISFYFWSAKRTKNMFAKALIAKNNFHIFTFLMTKYIIKEGRLEFHSPISFTSNISESPAVHLNCVVMLMLQHYTIQVTVH